MSLGSVYTDPRPYLERYPTDRKKLKRTAELRRFHGWQEPKALNPNALRWLVLYQCGSLTAKAISEQDEGYLSSYDTVKKALERAASVLGLPLRSGKRGYAPRKT